MGEENSQVEILNDRLKQINERLSRARKEGRDTLIPELTLRPFKAKMILARHDESAFDAAKAILDEAEDELREVEEEAIIDIKKEIAMMVGEK